MQPSRLGQTMGMRSAQRVNSGMPPRVCSACGAKASIRRPTNGAIVCTPCFFSQFEEEVHAVIAGNHLFSSGERVAIAASGGKDSTVLIHVMATLNARHDYGLDLFLLSVDEGITGYRDDSLEAVKRNSAEYGLPLHIVTYTDLYGWTMDEIVKATGKRNNWAMFCKAAKLVTGHNADDIAETVVMNVLRGDVARLARCTAVVTGEGSSMPRCKPFKFAYEKEIVMYAFHKRLDYFSTECVYAPNAYRGFAREFIKDIEAVRPSAIVDIIYSGEHMRVHEDATPAKQQQCSVCGYMSSNSVCKACVLLRGLAKGTARVLLAPADPLVAACAPCARACDCEKPCATTTK